MSDELKPEERAMFDRLRDEARLPSTLEERIVASLKERGLLRRSRSRNDRRALAAAVLATVVGFAAGGWFERPRKPPGPRWVLFLYSPAGRVDASPGGEEGRVHEYSAWAKELRARGVHISGEKLDDEGDGLGASGSVPLSTEGELGGWFLVEGQDREGALRIARSCPHLRHGGKVVLRRIAG
jgi:hypothetical protein